MESGFPAFIASANDGSSIGAAVVDVSVSDNLLPARPPPTAAADTQPLAVGTGVTVAVLEGSSSSSDDCLLLVRDDVAVATVSLVAEVAVYNNMTTELKSRRATLTLISTEPAEIGSFAQAWAVKEYPAISLVLNWTVGATAPQTPETAVSSLVNARISLKRSARASPTDTDVMLRVTVAVKPTSHPGMAPITGTHFAWRKNTEAYDFDYTIDGFNGSFSVRARRLPIAMHTRKQYRMLT
jgi:hypothetical protein